MFRVCWREKRHLTVTATTCERYVIQVGYAAVALADRKDNDHAQAISLLKKEKLWKQLTPENQAPHGTIIGLVEFEPLGPKATALGRMEDGWEDCWVLGPRVNVIRKAFKLELEIACTGVPQREDDNGISRNGRTAGLK